MSTRAIVKYVYKIFVMADSFLQVMDIVDGLFVTMFDKLNEKCRKELEAVGRQYPFTPLKVRFVFWCKMYICA